MRYLIKFTIGDKAWEVGATETELEAKGYCSGYCSAIINHTKEPMNDAQRNKVASQFSIVRIGDESKKPKKKVTKSKGKKNVKNNKG